MQSYLCKLAFPTQEAADPRSPGPPARFPHPGRAPQSLTSRLACDLVVDVPAGQDRQAWAPRVSL